MAEFVKVEASWLPSGWETDAKLEVSFHDDGQLSRLAKVRDGKPIAELTLEHGVARGRQTDHQGLGGTADWVTHIDGLSENFDAWSDNVPPFRDPFAEFVRRSIARVIAS